MRGKNAERNRRGAIIPTLGFALRASVKEAGLKAIVNTISVLYRFRGIMYTRLLVFTEI